MSLELELKANTEAARALTEVMTRVANGQDAIIGAAKAATACKSGAKAAETTSTTSAKTETTSTGAASAVDGEALKAKINGWAAAEGISDAEKEARKTELKGLFAKLKVTKFGEVPADKYPALEKAINTLISRGNLAPEAPAGADDEGDDLLG